MTESRQRNRGNHRTVLPLPSLQNSSKNKITKPSVDFTRQSSKSKLNGREKGTKKSGMQHNFS